MTTEFTIGFVDANSADAGTYAADLKDHLAMVAPDVQARQLRTDPHAMDMGATLGIVLAAPAIVALAKGIADWLKMRGSKPKLVIYRDGKKLIELDNMPGDDVFELLEGKLGEVVGK